VKVQRTVRLLARAGAIRRRSPRRLRPDDEAYVNSHGQLLAGLRRTLRSEPGLRTVVLFGSAARGDDRPTSDIDLAVEPMPSGQVAQRLCRKVMGATGRGLDLIDWRLAKQSPDMAPRLVREGRVLRDANSEWGRFFAQRRNILRRGRRREAIWSELGRQILG